MWPNPQETADLVEQPGDLDAKDSVNAYLSVTQGLNI